LGYYYIRIDKISDTLVLTVIMGEHLDSSNDNIDKISDTLVLTIIMVNILIVVMTMVH